jgi:hypothetical protein
MRIVPADTILYRCRQHDGKTKVSEAEDICSPKEEYALYPNRMSPAGIPMFYCAFKSETAKAETIDKDDKLRPFFTMAEFKVNEQLLIVDFTKLPPVPSIFDERGRRHYFRLAFLKQFVEDLSKPISRDGREHMEYIPTQVVTEYIRFLYSKTYKQRVDGIIFPSSKHKDYSSCVLFFDHEESLEALSLLRLTKIRI